MRTVLSLAVLPLLIPLQSITAQQAPPIETDSRIRVTAPTAGADKLAGVCVEVDATRLRVQAEEQVSPLTISLTDVTRLEVSQGRKSNTLKGLGFGALGGAVIGAVAGVIVEASCTYECWGTAATALIGAGVFSVTGAVIGIVAGTLIKSERWEEVPLDRLQVSIVPQRDGRFALGLSVAF
jgi:hypothetical protein